MASDQDFGPERGASNRSSARVAAVLVLVGQVAFIVVTQFHPGGDANDHPAIFATYAHSDVWGLVHVLQFFATAVIVAGLVLLCSAAEAGSHARTWPARLGAAFAVTSLALYGVLQAVDGVGNQQVDQAWVAAEGTERSVRFASAESMRWLEWGVSSYYSFAAGLALIAVAVAIRSISGSRILGSVIALSGISLFVRGGVAGMHGFTATHSALIVATWVLTLTWSSWLLATSRRVAPA